MLNGPKTGPFGMVFGGWMDGRMDGWTDGRMDGHSLIEMLGRIEKEKENLLLAETCVWQMD